MEKMLGERKYLDKGNVALLDVFGNDEEIIEAARVSYQKGTTPTSDTRTLLRYLVRHKHTSPLEMAEVKFYLKVPIFVARQLIRHRTANVNESSARYSILSDEFYVPELEQMQPQSTTNKQGRAAGEPIEYAENTRMLMTDCMSETMDLYGNILGNTELSREIARIITPVSVYTTMYWKIDLHNYFHFLNLRLDSHAQWEIRQMAQAMFDLTQPHFPIAHEAFQDYIQHARTLSRGEQIYLANRISGTNQDHGLSDRELKEFDLWYETILRK